MDIEYFGANCIRLVTKKATVVVDDNLSKLGGKSITKDTDITAHTQETLQAVTSKALAITTPGEFEASGITVIGVQARAHTDPVGVESATMYKFVADDTHILVTGHVYPDLSDDQLEEIGRVDIMIVPVGGHGFTLDPVGALKLIKKFEPSVVVPTSYEVKGLQYEVPGLELEDALKGLNMQAASTVDKLKTKDIEKNTQTSLIIIAS